MQENDHAARAEQTIFDGPSGALKGTLTLRLPLFTGVTLELPATLDMAAGISTLAPDCMCLEAQGTVEAPLLLALPLIDGQGSLDLDIALSSNASLRMALPGRHGLVQATGLATGPVVLALALPQGSGTISARSLLATPFTLTMVVPDGRAKLGVAGSVSGEVKLKALVPGGGQIDVSTPFDGHIEGVVFLPSGRSDLTATIPVHTTVHLNALPIPQTESALTLDIAVDGTAALSVEMPEHKAHLRTHFAASLPLAPLVELIRSEVAQQIRVERFELRAPRLIGAHELELTLYVEARKGVRAKVDVTANLRIDPRSKQIELQSIRAHGRNATGSIVGSFFLNPRLFRPLRHTCLFDPATMLPPGMRVEALSFRSADTDALVIAGEIAYEQQI